MQRKADSFARITRKRKGKVVCTSKVSVKLTLKDIGKRSFTETRKTGDKANETESKCIRRVRQRVRATLHLCEARLPLRWPLPLPILFCDENSTSFRPRNSQQLGAIVDAQSTQSGFHDVRRGGICGACSEMVIEHCGVKARVRLGQLQSWTAGVQCTGSHV